MKMLGSLATMLVSIAPAHASVELPRYPGAAAIPVGDELAIRGERFRIWYFTTSDSVGTAARYFAEHWRRMGLPTAVDGRPGKEMIVSAFYTREGLQQAVLLRPRLGKTIGFTAVRDLWFGAAVEDDTLSRPEGALLLSDVESLDGATRSHHRASLVDSKLEAVVEAIKADLAKTGYALTSETASEAAGRRHIGLEHSRGERHLVSHVAEIEGGATALVQSCLGCLPAPANAAPRPRAGELEPRSRAEGGARGDAVRRRP